MERSKKHIIPKDRYRRKRRTFSGDEPERRDGPDQGSSQQDNMTEEREPVSQAPQDEDIETQAAPSDAEEMPATARRRENELPPETEREYAPGEEGYRDRSAPASMGGTAGMTTGPDDADRPSDEERHINDGNGGNDGNRRRGCLGGFLLPFIAGLLGALAMLLLFNFLNDDGSGGNGTEDGADTEEAADRSVSEENEQEMEDIKGQLKEESGNSEKVVSDTTAAIQKAKQSVVSIINLQRMGEVVPGLQETPESEPEEAGTGSGVIYKLTDDHAYIVTNNHVVEGATELQVNLENGDQLSGEIVGTDLWTDLAVVRVERGNIDDAIDFGNSDQLLVGETAIAIGSPLGQAFSGSVSRGIISGLDRSVPVDIDTDGNYDWEANVLQTDAAINPGNSGGALVDQNGDLIGINSMKISMPTVEGIGFAIPANEVEQIVTQLEENGEVQRPYLGVLLQDLYTVPAEVLVNEMNLPDDVNSGVIISHVEEGTPADAAGLEALDVVVSLDGNEVENMMELRKYLYYEKEQGEEMQIEYYRDGQLQQTTATLE
ncbi:S1C family serine protease [Salinicoccus roseus]|uniref:S1C family serine protease n=1 Tax=Salinicoccus roseus TaxID=45670 RepID=UPI0022FFE5DD|nr:trypsin-like peptidase domain-containing protein [Salinicoccus roseus]